MTSSRVGDTHNFGRFVYYEGNWVIKPRPVYWEWLFLSRESPLRTLSHNISSQSRKRDPFEFFPDLKFIFNRKGPLPYSGKVERFIGESVRSRPNQLSIAVGFCLAVIKYFGISDLHIENMAYGTKGNEKREFYFPLDIECLFSPIDMLSQSYILDSTKNDPIYVGVNSIKNSKVCVAEVVHFFLEALLFLSKNTKQYTRVFNNLPIEKIPIRVLVKNTSSYINYMNSTNSRKMYTEEKLQMERGDVPYFFSFLGDKHIYYLGDSGPIKAQFSFEEVSIKKMATKDKCIGLLNSAQVKQSLLQICRTFDDKSDNVMSYENIKINYCGDDILVDVGAKWKIRSNRLC